MRKITIFLVIIYLSLALIYYFNNRQKADFSNKKSVIDWSSRVFLKWFPFNRENALDEWQEKIFKGRVMYVVKLERDGGYLFAKSDKSASGLFYKISYDARKYPMISWRWQVNQFPWKKPATKASRAWIEKDDFAARIYIIFPAFYFMNTKCLEYIWDENLPKGKIITSPYFKNIKLIVAESGSSNLGKWVFVERNIAEDFKAAFGYLSRGKIGAIAIMTNANNTESVAQAQYSEIRVGYGKNEKD